jgi:tetratricopeptide (TPR) repeat protein
LFITASQVNDMNIAVAAAQDCLEIASQIGDEWAIAKAKQFLTLRAIFDSDYVTAERLAHETLGTFERNGDKWSASVLSIEVLGLLAITQRQFDKATKWIEHGLRAAQDIDSKYAQQMAYWQLGFVATLEENYSRAAMYWNKALELGGGVIGSPVLMGFAGSSNSGEWGGRKLIDF